MWRLLRWPHSFLLMLVSLALPAALHYQGRLLQDGWLREPMVASMPTLYWAGMAAALALLTLLSLRFVIGHYPGKATVCWAVWSVTAFSLLMIPVARGPWLQTPLQRDGIRIAAYAGAGDIYLLDVPTFTADGQPEADDAALATLMLYAHQPLPRISHAQVQQARAEPMRLFVLSPADRTLGEGYLLQQVLDASGYKLWSTMPASPNVVTMPAAAAEADAPAAPEGQPAASDTEPASDTADGSLPNWSDLLNLPWLGHDAPGADSADRTPSSKATQSKTDFTGASTQPTAPQR